MRESDREREREREKDLGREREREWQTRRERVDDLQYKLQIGELVVKKRTVNIS